MSASPSLACGVVVAKCDLSPFSVATVLKRSRPFLQQHQAQQQQQHAAIHDWQPHFLKMSSFLI